MNIWIDTAALQGTADTMLRSGALFGLKYLQKMGHQTGFDASQLSDRQQSLLENELISSQFNDSSSADLFVFAEDAQTLSAETGDQKIVSAGDWLALSHKICFPDRTANHHRKTSETDITVNLNLDGTGESDIETGIGFLDHMLEQISRHGLLDLELHCTGDLGVDEHHSIEDVAITLGEAITKALGEKTGIQRYGFVLPMDESQAQVVLDLSGRPYLVFEADFNREKVGDFPTEMVEHFFYSLAMNLKANLQIAVEGSNDHHKIEACFKGFARSLRAAISRSERQLNILPSTKNLL